MSLVELNFYSRCLSKSVNVTVVLPYGNWCEYSKRSDYSKEEDCSLEEKKPSTTRKEYKVLYLLHGYQGDNLSWLRNTSVEIYAERSDTIIVMPSGENSFYVNIANLNLRMEDFITQELREFIESTFPIKKERSSRAIAGLSMGGYGSLRLGLLYPAIYSAVAAFSPPYLTTDKEISPFFFGEFKDASEIVFGKSDSWLGSTYDIYYLAETLKNRLEKVNLPEPYIYLACGEQDELLYGNRKMAKILQEKSQNYKYTEGNGGHVWAYWNRHLARFLSYWAESYEANLDC